MVTFLAVNGHCEHLFATIHCDKPQAVLLLLGFTTDLRNFAEDSTHPSRRFLEGFRARECLPNAVGNGRLIVICEYI